MKIQQQRIPCSGVPTTSNIPNTQLTPLEEIIDRVNSAVEITTREFQYLTSWLLHRGERRQRERHGFSHLRGGDDHQSVATEGRSRWEACSRNRNQEGIQKQQFDGERGHGHHPPISRPHSSSPSSSCHSWSTHLENHEVKCCVSDRKGKGKEATQMKENNKPTLC
jgi:hypothetical protein